jgi:hypothetical protein
MLLVVFVRDGEAGGVAGCCHKGPFGRPQGCEWGERHAGGIANAPGGT